MPRQRRSIRDHHAASARRSKSISFNQVTICSNWEPLGTFLALARNAGVGSGVSWLGRTALIAGQSRPGLRPTCRHLRISHMDGSTAGQAAPSAPPMLDATAAIVVRAGAPLRVGGDPHDHAVEMDGHGGHTRGSVAGVETSISRGRRHNDRVITRLATRTDRPPAAPPPTMADARGLAPVAQTPELSRCAAIPVAVLVIDRTQHVDG